MGRHDALEEKNRFKYAIYTKAGGFYGGAGALFQGYRRAVVNPLVQEWDIYCRNELARTDYIRALPEGVWKFVIHFISILENGIYSIYANEYSHYIFWDIESAQKELRGERERIDVITARPGGFAAFDPWEGVPYEAHTSWNQPGSADYDIHASATTHYSRQSIGITGNAFVTPFFYASRENALQCVEVAENVVYQVIRDIANQDNIAYEIITDMINRGYLEYPFDLPHPQTEAH